MLHTSLYPDTVPPPGTGVLKPKGITGCSGIRRFIGAVFDRALNPFDSAGLRCGSDQKPSSIESLPLSWPHFLERVEALDRDRLSGRFSTPQSMVSRESIAARYYQAALALLKPSRYW